MGRSVIIPRGRRAVGLLVGPLRVGLLLGGLLMGAPGCASFQGSRLFVSGTEHLDRGDTQAAIADLERAAALWPDASEVQNHLGLAYASAGRHPEALSAFQRAVDLDCDNQAARANLEAARRRQARVARQPVAPHAAPEPAAAPR